MQGTLIKEFFRMIFDINHIFIFELSAFAVYIEIIHIKNNNETGENDDKKRFSRAHRQRRRTTADGCN